jgi:hypothetical protein
LFRAKRYPTPDSREPNDTFTDAKTLTPIDNSEFNVNINHDEDNDYYKITFATASLIDIQLKNVPSGADYRIELFNGPGDEYWFSSPGLSRRYTGERPSGTYYIRVYSLSGYSSANYKLTFLTSPISTIGLNGQYSKSDMNNSGVVYYKLPVSENIGLRIDLYGFGSSGYQVSLYELNGGNYTEIAYGERDSSGAYAISKSLTSKTYRIAVFRTGGQGVSYTIKTSSTSTSLAAVATSSGFPTTMTAGEQKSVIVTVTNTGAVAWTNANGFKLGTSSNTPVFTASEHTFTGAVEYGQSKDFTITLTAPNITAATDYTLGFRMKQNSLSFGSTAANSITVSPPTETLSPGSTGKTVAGVTEKWYKLTNLSIGKYVFRILYTSASSDTTLTLYNSDITRLAYNDDIYNRYSGSVFSRIEYNVTTAGTYYLKVGGYNGTAVTCRVTANSYTDSTLNVSATVNNQLEGFYKFTPSNTGNYVISTKKYGATNYDTYLFLLDSSGMVLNYNDDGDFMAFDDDGGDGSNCLISLYLQANRYYYFAVKHNRAYVYNKSYYAVVE